MIKMASSQPLIERIGTEFVTNEGYMVRVIDYKRSNEVLIEFQDEHKYQVWVAWKNLKRGSIRNPFHISVYGIGYGGVLPDGTLPKSSDRAYKVWKSMLERCYSGYEKFKSYENVTVCERWHCYANFYEDLPKIKNYEYWLNNPKQRISLNKDMYYVELGIETEHKVYSLETVRFISSSENAKEVAQRRYKDVK